MSVGSVLLSLLLAVAVVSSSATAVSSDYPMPNVLWMSPPGAVVNSEIYGLPCVHSRDRVVVFPHYNNATPGFFNVFTAYSVDGNGSQPLWEVRWPNLVGSPGLYCAASQRSSKFFLGGGMTVRSVFTGNGTTIGEAELPPLSPASMYAGSVMITTSEAGQVFATYGGPLHVYDDNLNLQYRAGHSMWQHVPAFYSGLMYFNDFDPERNHTRQVVARTSDGKEVWGTFAQGDGSVGTSSVVMVASYNTNPEVVNAYAAATGTFLWSTTDFYDYNVEGPQFVGVYPGPAGPAASSTWTIRGRDSVTGARLWSVDAANTSPPTITGSGMVFTHGQMVYPALTGSLLATRLLDGKVQWRFSQAIGCIAYNGVAFEGMYFLGVGGSCGGASAGVYALQI